MTKKCCCLSRQPTNLCAVVVAVNVSERRALDVVTRWTAEEGAKGDKTNVG